MRRSQFGQAVLLKIAPNVGYSRERACFMVAWAAYEGSEALNNPFDTTEPYEGATDYNNVGVRNYATWEDGVDATVRTLVNGYYEHFLKVLRNKDATVRELLNALDATPWGSHPNTELYQDVVLEYAKYDSEVAGSPTYVPPLSTIYSKDKVIPEIVNKGKEETMSEYEKVENETTEATPDEKEDTLEKRMAAAGLAPTPVAQPVSQIVEPEAAPEVVVDPNEDTLEKRLASTGTETDTPKDEQ